jgi:hypothetical protein
MATDLVLAQNRVHGSFPKSRARSGRFLRRCDSGRRAGGAQQAGKPTSTCQARAKLGAEAKRAAIESPATLYVFDLLAFGGYDLRKLPLIKRKEILHQVLPQTGPLRYSEHFEKNGEALYEQVVKLGLEGIMAKKADSPYRSGRSGDWLKIRADRIDDFVVVGFSKPKGSRGGFGSLHVGAFKDRTLICGRADPALAAISSSDQRPPDHSFGRHRREPPKRRAAEGADHVGRAARVRCPLEGTDEGRTSLAIGVFALSG